MYESMRKIVVNVIFIMDVDEFQSDISLISNISDISNISVILGVDGIYLI